MLTKDMGLIDFSKDALSLERLIRGLNPWPSAFTVLNAKLLKIFEADILSEEEAVSLRNNISGDAGGRNNF